MAIKLMIRQLAAQENLRRAENDLPPLTQQEIAKGSGISQPVVSTLLGGKVKRIDIKTINGVCNFFKVTPNDIFEYSPD